MKEQTVTDMTETRTKRKMKCENPVLAKIGCMGGTLGSFLDAKGILRELQTEEKVKVIEI